MSTHYLLCITLITSLFIGFCRCEDPEHSPLAALVRKSLEPLTRSCVSKVGAKEADLEYIRHDPPYPHNTACIITCLFEKIGIVKNNKYSKNGFITVITPMVLSNKKKMEHMTNVSETCDKEIETSKKDKCQVGNKIITCIYKYAPELQVKF